MYSVVQAARVEVLQGCFLHFTFQRCQSSTAHVAVLQGGGTLSRSECTLKFQRPVEGSLMPDEPAILCLRSATVCMTYTWSSSNQLRVAMAWHAPLRMVALQIKCRIRSIGAGRAAGPGGLVNIGPSGATGSCSAVGHGTCHRPATGCAPAAHSSLSARRAISAT